MPSGRYILPELDASKWEPIDRILSIRFPKIGSFEFFYLVINFGDVYYAIWSEQFATVRFLSKEVTDRCFDDLARRGYEVVITSVGAFFHLGNFDD